MQDMIEAIYNTAYNIWNSLIHIAVTLFTTSPTSANGGIYATTHNLYNAISNIAMPIATVFFLIAIIRDVIATPPDQQIRRFLGSAIKYCVMLGILANLWTIMGQIMGVADGVTDALSRTPGTTYNLRMPSDLRAVIAEVSEWPDFGDYGFTFSLLDIGGMFSSIFQYFLDLMGSLLIKCFMIIMGVATLIILIASAITILSSAFQRILKPLVLIPFASITVAMGAGNGDASRVMTSYLKTFFGFCISGAFMVISVKLGVALSNSGLIAFNIDSLSLTEKAIYLSVQNAITPIVVAGLVKTSDSILSRFF